MGSGICLDEFFEKSMGTAVLDRFGGASMWDEFVEWREAQYAALIAGKTCLDCGNCVRCDVEGHEGVGYCKATGEFVTGDDAVESVGCEEFVS